MKKIFILSLTLLSLSATFAQTKSKKAKKVKSVVASTKTAVVAVKDEIATKMNSNTEGMVMPGSMDTPPPPPPPTVDPSMMQVANGAVAPIAQQVPVAAAPIVVDEKLCSLDKDIHDFGKIPQGSPVTTYFSVTNKSDKPLRISNVQAGCGCTTPEWTRDESVAPGATTKIKVGFNAGSMGQFDKPVTIYYNDGMSKAIKIKGEVYTAPAVAAPENKAVGQLKN